MKWETEGFIITTNDQSSLAREYEANAFINGSDHTCRICGNVTRTIGHIVFGCPVLAEKEFLIRHDKIEQYIPGNTYKYDKLKSMINVKGIIQMMK